MTKVVSLSVRDREVRFSKFAVSPGRSFVEEHQWLLFGLLDQDIANDRFGARSCRSSLYL
jgi:hypothetical protein